MVMARITKAERERIRIAVEKEFPDDPVLQQVHIARKVLSKKAELEGLSFGEYIMKRHRQEVNSKTGLRFRQKVESGLKELDAGKGIPHKVVREKLKKRF